jgi:hypothetical protein
MEWLYGLAVIGGMVLLRIAVPILIMVLLVWALRRLNARWEAEADKARVERNRPQPLPSPSVPAILERSPSASLPESG